MRQHRPRDQEVTELPQSCRVDQVEAFMLRCWGFALYLTAPSAAVHAPCIPPPPPPPWTFTFPGLLFLTWPFLHAIPWSGKNPIS